MSVSTEIPRFPVISASRELRDYPIGNKPLAAHQAEWSDYAGAVTFRPQAWIGARDLERLKSRTLVDANGEALAWSGERPDDSETIAASHSFLIRYPWDLLRANETYVSLLAENEIEGEVHPLAVIEGACRIGPGTRILPGVFIEGNVIIGANCKIGPNCYIRGNTSIGDKCHIGQSVEIKNCLILSGTNVGHLSYVGDSVLGEKVNFGAGTTVSNLRHDGKNHRSTCDGELIDTGRRKFGAIVGDGVHTGINTSIYPGRQLWPETFTRPGDVVVRDLSF